MSRVSKLRQARNNTSVIHKEFLTNRKEKCMHVFYEGDDDISYYLYHIELQGYNIEDIERYRCGNKKRVIDVYNKITGSVGVSTGLFFFVDSDYEEYAKGQNLTPSRIYKSDFYSVESEVVNEYILRKVFMTQFHRLPAKETADKFIQRWRRFYELFVKNIAVDFFAALIYARELKVDTNFTARDFKKLLKIDRFGRCTVEIKNRIKNIRRIFSRLYSDKAFSSKRLRKIKEEIKYLKPLHYIRGKQAYMIFLFFLENEKKRYSEKYGNRYGFTTSYDYNTGTSLCLFLNMTRTPDSLKAYIMQHALSS